MPLSVPLPYYLFSQLSGANWRGVVTPSVADISAVAGYGVRSAFASGVNVYASTNREETWALDNAFAANVASLNYVIDGAINRFMAGLADGSIYTQDNGGAWVLKNAGAGQIVDFGLSNLSHGVSFNALNATGTLATTILAVSNTGHIYRSTDKGLNWAQVFNTADYVFHTVAFCRGTWLAAARRTSTPNGTAILASADDGVTWNQVALVAGNNGAAKRWLRANGTGWILTQADPTGLMAVAAASFDGVNFAQVLTLNGSNINSVDTNFNGSLTAFTESFNNAIFVSTDLVNWQRLTDTGGQLAGDNINCLAFIGNGRRFSHWLAGNTALAGGSRVLISLDDFGRRLTYP